ncbi:MAG: DUF4831 family protein [Alistipes sp.]|nr:DUF4831 family protein [Alistipes sp.]
MKKFLMIMALATLGVVSASAQNNIYKTIGVSKDAKGNIVISDPSTILAVDLTFEEEQIVVGPYAKYAQKYLETRPSLVDKSTLTLKSAEVAIVTDSEFKAKRVARDKKSAVSYLGDEDEFAKVSPDRVNSSSMSPENAAAQAAQAIFTIRKNRMDLISGEAGENVFGAGLKDALAELDAKEQAYLELFLGKKVVKTFTKRFIIPVVAGQESYSVARFSNKGIVENGEATGNEVKLILTPSAATPKFSSISEVDARDKTAIAVRIANMATCSVVVGEKQIVSNTVLPIFELGRTAYISAGLVK